MCAHSSTVTFAARRPRRAMVHRHSVKPEGRATRRTGRNTCHAGMRTLVCTLTGIPGKAVHIVLPVLAGIMHGANSESRGGGSGPEWARLRLPEPNLQNFLDKQELSALDKPIVFEQHEKFGSYLCFSGVVQLLGGMFIPALTQPIQTLCGSSLAKSHSLEASFARTEPGSQPPGRQPVRL